MIFHTIIIQNIIHIKWQRSQHFERVHSLPCSPSLAHWTYKAGSVWVKMFHYIPLLWPPNLHYHASKSSVWTAVASPTWTEWNPTSSCSTRRTFDPASAISNSSPEARRGSAGATSHHFWMLLCTWTCLLLWHWICAVQVGGQPLYAALLRGWRNRCECENRSGTFLSVANTVSWVCWMLSGVGSSRVSSCSWGWRLCWNRVRRPCSAESDSGALSPEKTVSDIRSTSPETSGFLQFPRFGGKGVKPHLLKDHRLIMFQLFGRPFLGNFVSNKSIRCNSWEFIWQVKARTAQWSLIQQSTYIKGGQNRFWRPGQS